MTPLLYHDGQQLGSWTVVKAYTERAGYCTVRCRCGKIASKLRATLKARGGSCRSCSVVSSRLPIGTTRGDVILVGREDGLMVSTCRKCGTTRKRHGLLKSCGVCRGKDGVGDREALEATGVSRQGIFSRLAAGWTREEARSIPKGELPPRLVRERAEAPPTLSNQCRAANLSPSTYRARRKRGLSHEQALSGEGVRRGRPPGRKTSYVRHHASCPDRSRTSSEVPPVLASDEA